MSIDNDNTQESVGAGTVESKDKSASTGLKEVVLSKRDIIRNIIVIIMLDSMYAMGFGDFQLVMTPLLTHLHASNTIIGLITSIRFVAVAGVVVSPFISRRFRIKKWYMIIAVTPYLTVMLLMGLGVLFGAKHAWSDAVMIRTIVMLSFTQWFLAGFVDVPHLGYVAACIPNEYRGRYTGWSLTIGSVLSITSAWAAKWILSEYPLPEGFGYVILLAWFITQFGYTVSLLAKERPTPIEKVPNPWSKQMLKDFWADKAFVRFLAVTILNTMLIAPVLTFVSVYGFSKLLMPAAFAGIIGIMGQCIRIPTSFIFGNITDRIGPKKMYPFWFLITGVSLLIPLFMNGKAPVDVTLGISKMLGLEAVLLSIDKMGVLFAIGLSTIAGVAQAPSMFKLLYGLPKPEQRDGHFSVQLILNWIAVGIGPLIAGILCDCVGYKPVFLVGAIISFLFFPFSKWMLSVLGDDLKSYS